MLNRPTDTPVDDVVPRWGLAVSEPSMVFRGGPVAINGAICVARVAEGEVERALADDLGIGFGLAGDPDTDSELAELSGALEAAAAAALADPAAGDENAGVEQARPPFRFIVGSLGTVDLHHRPEDVPLRLAAARVFAGYSGWGAGQLEAEIDAGAWFVVDAEEGDIFDDDPEHLWPRVLRRQPGWLKVLACYPPDPSVN